MPRNGAPASPESRLNKLTIMRLSGDARARPSASFLTPAESNIASVSSFVRELTSSALAPLLTTIARSSRPVTCRVLTRPVDIASTEISTATTPAIPMMTTDDVPIRCGRLRIFIAETAAIWARAFMAGCSSDRKRVDDVQPLSAHRRRQATDDGQQHRHGESAEYHGRRQYARAQCRADGLEGGC